MRHQQGILQQFNTAKEIEEREDEAEAIPHSGRWMKRHEVIRNSGSTDLKRKQV